LDVKRPRTAKDMVEIKTTGVFRAIVIGNDKKPITSDKIQLKKG
jgi:hypothetical protein